MMGFEPNHTHDPARTSWLVSANVADTDFPIQNLPFAVFRRAGSSESWRGGVAIGDRIVDLAALDAAGRLQGLAAQAAAACAQPALNAFMALGPPAWQALRHGLFALLEAQAAPGVLDGCLVPQAEAEFSVPARIGDYTDFYTSYHHALNIGKLFGIDEVAPNFHHMPVAYHGRASSVVVSGTPVRRPLGQSKAPAAAAPGFGPCAWLDYELELGIFVGTGNALGTPVPLRDAESHLFGICLLNDWSARDIQGWEMQPLGPFLAKNFSTSISPWIVSMEALAPYRVGWQRDPAFSQPLPYLDSAANRAAGALDIRLEVGLETPSHRGAGTAPARLTQTSFRHQHWTVAQMLAHHTVGGCNLQPGDLLGSGTISGPSATEAGAMMELSRAGRQPVAFEGGDGRVETRGFLADGDTVVLRGWCEAPGRARIGFGVCRGTVLPALDHLP
jgi:fumarylacetoacetase